MLSGTPQLRERWKRGVGAANGALGEAVGSLTWRSTSPPRLRPHGRAGGQPTGRVPGLHREPRVDDRGHARGGAQELSGFTPRSASRRSGRTTRLEIRGDDLGNVVRTTQFAVDQLARKAGQPVEHERLMTPQTVNAYYHPLRNEIASPPPTCSPRSSTRLRRRRELWRHRLGDRPRDRARLRRQGLHVRRRGPAAQLVDRRGPRGLRGAHRPPGVRGSPRPVRRRRRRAARQRRAHPGREHRRLGACPSPTRHGSAPRRRGRRRTRRASTATPPRSGCSSRGATLGRRSPGTRRPRTRIATDPLPRRVPRRADPAQRGRVLRGVRRHGGRRHAAARGGARHHLVTLPGYDDGRFPRARGDRPSSSRTRGAGLRRPTKPPGGEAGHLTGGLSEGVWCAANLPSAPPGTSDRGAPPRSGIWAMRTLPTSPG
ncbi:hypothetical protein QJS66_16460 [Kocuria rhizophila]|nr:hypothetical protein QJS66_16460 [Kocuria rhizophila]